MTTTAPAPALRAPFPWFGGKSLVAHLVWPRFGDTGNYVEPFAGSLAVLLGRPHDHEGTTETANDLDGFLSNFWRANQADPEQVAHHADWPVNELDLEARQRWLCTQPEKGQFLERMKHEHEYFCPKRAGFWLYGICQWIGGGWCAGEYFPEAPGDSHGMGICQGASKLPHIGDGGRGINRKLPLIGNGGMGINRKLPLIGNGGMGIHRQRPRGTCAERTAWLMAYMQALSDRLRNVRVCCGDWQRVCTDGALAHGTHVGVFLDPPYSAEADRDGTIYREEDLSVAHDCRAWCLAHGDNPRYRIALCGYEGEHEELEARDWTVVAWKANGGFGNFAKYGPDNQAKLNRHRERLWFSPHCLPVAAPVKAPSLFGAEEE